MIDKIIIELQKLGFIGRNVNYLKVKTRESLNNYVGFILFDKSSPKYVVKISRNPNKAFRLKKEETANRLFKEITPNIVLYGGSYLVEEYIPGKRLNIFITDRNFLRLSDKSYRIISEFHNTYQCDISVDDLMAKTYEIGTTFDCYLDLDVSSFKTFNISYIHGDYNPHNIILSSGNLRIIDWEDYEYSFSIIDMVHFIIVYLLIMKKRQLDIHIIKYIYTIINRYYKLDSINQLFKLLGYYLITMIAHEESDFRLSFIRQKKWLHLFQSLKKLEYDFNF